MCDPAFALDAQESVVAVTPEGFTLDWCCYESNPAPCKCSVTSAEIFARALSRGQSRRPWIELVRAGGFLPSFKPPPHERNS